MFLANRLGYECGDISAVGGNKKVAGQKPKIGAEGGWPICLDYWNISERPICNVFSFGINNDFSFDDEVYDRWRCKVYSFDPSMEMKTQTREKSEFLREGLFGIPGDSMTTPNGKKHTNGKLTP